MAKRSDTTNPPATRKCSVEGCPAALSARGYCCRHYRKWRATGDPGGLETMRASARSGERWVIEHHHYDGPKCLIWPFKTQNGYAGWITTAYGRMLAYRYMCILAHGPPRSSEDYALHSCGNGIGGCCDPQCLYWGTQAQNIADTLTHGTRAWGERLPQSVLTEESVREIRRTEEPVSSLAKRFCVSHRTIRDARNRVTWKHVN